jgi:Holliday junction DNA helicase RuvB
LQVAVDAARSRRESLDHVLLCGQPDLAQNELVQVLGNKMCAKLSRTSARAIERPNDLARLVTNLEKFDILLVENIHLLRPAVEACLLRAMKDFEIDIVIDQRPLERSVNIKLMRFTVVATTEDSDDLSSSLFSSFRIVEQLEPYTESDIIELLSHSEIGQRLIGNDPAALWPIAERANGSPRVALNLAKHVMDYAEVKQKASQIRVSLVKEALSLLPVNHERRTSQSERIRISPEVRREVWRRDGGMCARCGSRENLGFDHIIPISQGGSNTVRNIELLCD